jgi:hypothetical protein
LHFHAPHKFEQSIRIWNKYLTSKAMYCEFDRNQMISKFVKMILSPWQPLTTFFFSRGESQHQIDKKKFTHQQVDQFQCRNYIHCNIQGIRQQVMTSNLIHHTCIYHMIQTSSDSFNNDPHHKFVVLHRFVRILCKIQFL